MEEKNACVRPRPIHSQPLRMTLMRGRTPHLASKGGARDSARVLDSSPGFVWPKRKARRRATDEARDQPDSDRSGLGGLLGGGWAVEGEQGAGRGEPTQRSDEEDASPERDGG